MEEKKSSMKRILVGYDGSEGAEKALAKALTLIEENGEIILLAVIPSKSEKSFVDADAYKLAKERAQQLLQEKLDSIKSENFIITPIIERGDAAEKIIDTASKKECDLIILGRHGHSEISPSTLGNVAEKVVTHAHKPVMVVK
ncbi:MAG TPA: universal stress protein [Thermoplasmatales archaeon]|nr:universal stress protein [Thermoplasmatales archaeon]